MVRWLVTFLSILALAACGKPAPLTDSKDIEGCTPGGIWRAADGTVALIDQSPRAHVVQPDGVQYVGDLSGVVTTGTKHCFLDKPYSVMHVALPLGTTLPNGAVSAKGEVNGSWKRRKGHLDLWGTLDGDVRLSFTGAYDPRHAEGSQRTTVAGAYRPSTDPTGEVLTIDANGVVFSQSSVTGCTVNGSIDPVDARFNVYRLSLDYAGCRGPAAVLNGLSARGLATYDASQNPDTLFVALDVSGDTQHYSVVRILQRL